MGRRSRAAFGRLRARARQVARIRRQLGCARVFARGSEGSGSWCRSQSIKGLTIEIVAIEGKTPCLLFDVPTHGLGNDRTMFCYATQDKQPEMVGWREDLGPWKPVYETASCMAAAAPTMVMRSMQR